MLISNDFKCLFMLILGFIQWVSSYEMTRDYEEASHFDVMPGGAVLSHEKQLDGFTCKFTYACQGGTKEGWQLTINTNTDKTKYLCSVQRPDGKSYLFFQSFKLEFTGLEVKEGYAMGANFKPLSPSEYQVDFQKHSISDVAGKFGSQLEKVELYGEKGKAEL
ncbi:hypothetical protein LOTGIDRAFT_149784 [Lottia gigantea]|uniref:Myeloid-derived growth factor n=1 Tax=Lottia gigantea TaxID=225164 RepID=V4CF92_LOTGI|nr:hypothetical protein LOTGIDRAFT_149784 [Lottia gigantea]ESP00685.1 hypothetical protein LOTGIDRAFT_149784 [Lottia gigantea]